LVWKLGVILPRIARDKPLIACKIGPDNSFLRNNEMKKASIWQN
jgi:hypothetical protein